MTRRPAPSCSISGSATPNRARLAPFVRTARSLAGHRGEILEAISERVTNARTEATNTTLRLIVRRAYGFHSAAPMIALAMLKLGGPARRYRPPPDPRQRRLVVRTPRGPAVHAGSWLAKCPTS